jgi:signal transduction histidine kinase
LAAESIAREPDFLGVNENHTMPQTLASVTFALPRRGRAPTNLLNWRLIFSLLAVFCLAPHAVAQLTEAKNILVLYSQEREMGIYAPLDKALRSQLDADSSQPLVFYTEYLDLLRFPDETHQQQLLEYLRVKYTKRKIDLIFVVSPLALNFLLKNEDDLFHGIPVVFTSVNIRTVEKLSLKPNITGIAVNRTIRDTLDVALRLQPDTVHVIIPGGTSAIERGWTEDLRVLLSPYETHLTLSYVNDLSMANLLRMVSNPPPHTIVLFSALYFYDGAGHYFLPEEALDLITRASKAPVYGTDQTYLGRGIVGGHLYNAAEVGADAGKVGARILSGELPQNIPVQVVNPNYDGFDARQLKRWNISEARLPPGSVVRFRQPSLWDLYKWYILGCAAVFLLQFVFVVALIRLTRKLRQSESGLRDLSQNLINAQENERKRIARELHDDFSQRLALLRNQIVQLGQDDRGQTALDPGTVSAVCSAVDDLTNDLHRLSYALHSSKLELLGLDAALKELCDQVARGYPISVEFHSTELSASVPPDVALCLYRVAQEALSNAAKYSGTSHAVVTLSNGNGRVRMRIADNGKGFDTSRASKGMGLASMCERLRLVNGDLVIVSKPGAGTQVTAQVTLVPAPQEEIGLIKIAS